LGAENQREELIVMINSSLWRLPDGSVPMSAAFPMNSIPSIIYLTNCFVCFPVCFALTFFFFARIYQNFQKNRESMSERSAKLIRALNRALISQAFFPFILGVAPVTLVMSMVMFEFDIPLVGLIATGSLSWIPAVNPFLTIILVPAYFRALIPTRLLKTLAGMADNSVSPTSNVNNNES
jgi:hypothetical protein